MAAGAKPHQVAAALVDQARAARGTVIVLEDLHWADPYAAQLAGDATAAAALWTRLGCPYDAALALVESRDEDSLRVALDEF